MLCLQETFISWSCHSGLHFLHVMVQGRSSWHVASARVFGGGYIGIPLSVRLTRVNLTLAITFELKEIHVGLSYYMPVPCDRPFCFYRKCWPMTSTSFEKKLTLVITFEPRDKPLILHMCIPCGKTFLSLRNFFTSGYWPSLLKKKNLLWILYST